MEPKIGIVLVNFNGEKFQNDCIKTIKEMTYKNFEIIVVDNDSKDRSVEMLKKEYPDVKLIETGDNCGVAKGNNIGIKLGLEHGCEYILLLNNDTEVEKEMLSRLIKNASNKTLVTCKMYYYNQKNTIWCAGGKINWAKATTIHFGENQIDNGQFDDSKYIEYTPTCCLLIHKDIFSVVGYMDEKYFMYYDDTDFVARVNKTGYKIWYESDANLWHKVSSSSGGAVSKVSIYYGNRNRLYFINKFYKFKIGVLMFFYLTRLSRYFKYQTISKDLGKVLVKAIIDYKKHRMNYQDLNNI